MFNNLGVFFSFASPKVRHEGMSCGYCDRRAMSNGPKVGQGEMRSTEERCLPCHIMHEHFLCEQENPLWLLKEETPVGLCLFNDNSCNSI
ncbi:putative 2-hydroxyacid dehydrogenase UNK4.10 [Fusarium oxysporum f. sp. albedinis]|nr:putative 2-hydroxyacid dehydrogenase UNK4.10 [Fusarium oxysporum f. sp. albedinis]